MVAFYSIINDAVVRYVEFVRRSSQEILDPVLARLLSWVELLGFVQTKVFLTLHGFHRFEYSFQLLVSLVETLLHGHHHFHHAPVELPFLLQLLFDVIQLRCLYLRIALELPNVTIQEVHELLRVFVGVAPSFVDMTMTLLILVEMLRSVHFSSLLRLFGHQRPLSGLDRSANFAGVAR